MFRRIVYKLGGGGAAKIEDLWTNNWAIVQQSLQSLHSIQNSGKIDDNGDQFDKFEWRNESNLLS